MKISQHIDMTTIEGYKNSYFESDKSYLNIDITTSRSFALYTIWNNSKTNIKKKINVRFNNR